MSSHSTAQDAGLRGELRRLGSVAVAFSGGVDSGVLLHAAWSALGERAVAVTADSPSLPRSELRDARAFTRGLGVEHVVVRTDEMEDEGYLANEGVRCYHCKHALFRAMTAWAVGRGIRHLAFGEITDDLLDDRPGARAAAEFSVHAPLRRAGMGKEEVRAYARRHGLTLADKPAMACLASRIPVGRRVTPEDLATVERSEQAIRGLGFRVLRVRHLGSRARVEVGAIELELAQGSRARIADVLRAEGFEDYELAAYRSPGAS